MVKSLTSALSSFLNNTAVAVCTTSGVTMVALELIHMIEQMVVKFGGSMLDGPMTVRLRWGAPAS